MVKSPAVFSFDKAYTARTKAEVENLLPEASVVPIASVAATYSTGTGPSLAKYVSSNYEPTELCFS